MAKETSMQGRAFCAWLWNRDPQFFIITLVNNVMWYKNLFIHGEIHSGTVIELKC